ncbi:acetyltransferase (GNAT) family protein [Yoonia maricola]|uniref:Acetyltransferase (GNAT) family protein n=1 Tax=Yoonia maricola TaxID=420999 RepID=A0A2M8WND1_9RHOB|nr:GNAT family N-acetyltransferase [Yoonia maricola]PJI92429.1 acetyltransferase (GNAT) family protein [Yoonia maricola]
MTVKVTLAPLTADLTDTLRDIRVAADQVAFSGQPYEVIDDPEPGVDVHVILNEGQVVGMFRIDPGFHHTYPFAGPDTPGLRTFLVDQQMQGRGIAKACCMQLHDYLSKHYGDAKAVYLTVNLRNQAARKVYLASGFVDTGDQWLLGEAGPQNVLRLDLDKPKAPDR